MKKLIKYYDSTDPKLASYNFNSGNYGNFITTMVALATGDGFNAIDINKIEKTVDKKEVKFYFTTPGFYNHKITEVVNLQGKPQEEYEIIEVTNDYLTCIYYDDFEVISNEAYVGKILHSSMGMNLKSNAGGKLVLTDQNNVSDYIFYDKEDSQFINSGVKIVGMYAQSTLDPSIQAPQCTASTNYNDITQWSVSNGGATFRRCLMNLIYHNNMKFIIIGNGNFIYFILGAESYVSRMTIYCFGTFKKFISSDVYNAIIVSKDMIANASNSNIGTVWNVNKYPFGCNFISSFLKQTPQGNSNAIHNILASNSTSNTATAGTLVSTLSNSQILRGINSASGFSLLPNMNFGDSSKSGLSNIPYPNVENKMMLATVNIVSGTDNTTDQYTIRGKMPFMFWWGHNHTLAPGGNGSTFNMNDNGKNRKFLTVYNNNDALVSIIEITPTGYDNF